MELSEYLEREGLKKGWFAEKVGISKRTMSKICKGYKVHALMAKAIEVHTNGEVKAESMCREPKG